MLSEPKIDRSSLKNTLEDKYGIRIINLTFVPKGEVSWNYKVACEDGNTYFLKIHADTELPNSRFDLIYNLFAKAGIKNIIHPIKTTQDETLFYWDKFPAVLFNYVNGVNGFEKPFTDEQQIKIGQVLGQLHKAKDKIGEYPVKEKFEFTHKEELLRNLEEMNDINSQDNKYKTELMQLFGQYKVQVLNQLRLLEELGGRLREQSHDFVICHGDIHKGNILVDNQDEVYFIDWDNPIFAPKEKDLNYFKKDDLVLKGYTEVFGVFNINPYVIEFYNMRWTLSEIEDWSSRLLFDEHDEVQNEHYLKQIKSEFLDLRPIK